MAFKAEQVGYPLMIGAAVLGIWYALKGNTTPATVTATAPYASGVPTAPATQVSLGNPQVQNGIEYIVLATQNPYSATPGISTPTDTPGNSTPTIQGPPGYLTFNLPPNFAPKANVGGGASGNGLGKGGGCGCGGSCGGGGAAKSSCQSCPAAYADGNGSCLTSASKAVPAKVLQMSLANMASAGWPHAFESIA